MGLSPQEENRDRCMLELNEHPPYVFWEPQYGGKTGRWSDGPQVPCMNIPGELIPWGASIRSEKRTRYGVIRSAASPGAVPGKEEAKVKP